MIRLALVLVALAGSLPYGASVRPADRWRAGLRLTASAGLSWACFGPALLAATRKPAWVLADACLWTMAVGEAVLVAGAVVNLLAGSLAVAAAWTLLANGVMAAFLFRRLKSVGVAAG